MSIKFGPRYKVPFRRRREFKTDYRYRLRLLKSQLPRAVVRKSLKNTIIQFIHYTPDGDRVLVSASSSELHKLGWTGPTGNLPAAYLTGLLAGTRAASKKIESAVLDIGLNVPVTGSKVFASLKGILDAGIDIPHGEEILPSEERIKGQHISDNVTAEFDKIKNKITSGNAKEKNEKDE